MLGAGEMDKAPWPGYKSMTKRGTYPQNPTFRCIAVPHRREILRAMNTWRPPLTEQ